MGFGKPGVRISSGENPIVVQICKSVRIIGRSLKETGNRFLIISNTHVQNEHVHVHY